jgi:hypothetical protein
VKPILPVLFLLALLGARPLPGEPPALGPRARDLLTASLQYNDRLWDERTGLLWTSPTGATRAHDIRSSAWYALGLMLRDQPGDRTRAFRVVDVILGQQINDPGQPWDGTFFRTAEELQPTQFSHRWADYDPNWRQFIGTVFALFLIDYEDRLPAGLGPRLEDSIRRAVEGELAEHRLTPGYTNIALMHGFLQAFAGQRLHRPEWVQAGEAWAGALAAAFAEHQTFEEYNSPTYYGTDLYALALWRKHGPTDRFRHLGGTMEAALWRDIAAFYHAGLQNLAGPFDRAYGMDLRRYVSLTGLWLALVVDPPLVPLPDPQGPMDHAADFGFAPCLISLGAVVPADAIKHFEKFQGVRQVTRVITSQRTATAWLGETVMIGGEITQLSRAAGPASRTNFYPATIHWKTPGGQIGWILLHDAPRVDARATENQLTIAAIGDSTFHLSAPGLSADQLTRQRWTLPGLVVDVDTDAAGFTCTPTAGGAEVRYTAATRFVLHTRTQP